MGRLLSELFTRRGLMRKHIVWTGKPFCLLYPFWAHTCTRDVPVGVPG